MNRYLELSIISISELISPFTNELGIGGIGGFCIGYSIKKIARIISIIFTIYILGLQYLVNKGIVIIDNSSLESWITYVIYDTAAVQKILVPLILNMPLGVAFTGGLILGLKKG